MVVLGLISIIVLLCVYRDRIYRRIYGMKYDKALQSMSLQWVANGGNLSKINEILSKIYSLDGISRHSWVYEFSRIARHYYKIQLSLQSNKDNSGDNDPLLLSEIYDQSALWFGIAKYPFYLHNQMKFECYKLHKLCYIRSMKLYSNLQDFEVIEIPTTQLNNSCIYGYFHKAKTVKIRKTPKIKRNKLVIIIGSVDVWKSDIWFLIRRLLENNLSVFSIDLAGTGDIEWKLNQNSLFIYKKCIKWFKMRNNSHKYNININCISVFGIGFGGYFGCKLAADTEFINNIQCCINLSTPLIYTFNDREWIYSMNNNMIAACCSALYLTKKSPFNLYNELKKWSLNINDIIQIQQNNCKILTIFGDNDKFINIKDSQIDILNKNNNQKWIMKNDGYCCNNTIDKWLDPSIKWIKNNSN